MKKRRVKAWAVIKESGVIEATTEKFRATDLYIKAKSMGFDYKVVRATIIYELPKKERKR